MNFALPSLLCLSSLFALGPGPHPLAGDELAPLVQAQNPKPTAPAWQPEQASDVLLMIQAFYDSARDLQAKFEQTYTNPTFGETRTSSGKLALEKPDKMVWNYSGKGPDYYANGSQLWMIDHETRQVVRTKVAGNSEVTKALGFMFGGQKLIREFYVRYAPSRRVEQFGDATHFVVELRPKVDNKHYKGLLLAADATTGRVDRFVVYNNDGSQNEFQLRAIKTNTGVSAKRFNYALPRGYVETVE